MNLWDRIFHAVLGAFFGALIGVACWWLYGLAHSLNYSGPSMDPVLRHWVIWTSAALAATGFMFRHSVVDVIGDIISGIFHFEISDTSNYGLRTLASLVCLAIIIAAIWHTTPG